MCVCVVGFTGAADFCREVTSQAVALYSSCGTSSCETERSLERRLSKQREIISARKTVT